MRTVEEYREEVFKLERRVAKLGEQLESTEDLEASLSLQLKHDAAQGVLDRMRRGLAEAEAKEAQRQKEQELKQLEATLKDDGETRAITKAVAAALAPLVEQISETTTALTAESQRIAELQSQQQKAYRRYQELARELGRPSAAAPEAPHYWLLAGQELEADGVTPLVAHWGLLVARQVLAGVGVQDTLNQHSMLLQHSIRGASPSQPQPEEDER